MRSEPQPFKSLRTGAWLFIATWLVHTADHARRGISATTDEVVWAGTAVGLMAAVTITLIMVKHPTAPAIAAAVFPSIAIGVIASHLLPQWSALSDPLLFGSGTDGWSVVAAGSEIIAAIVLGASAVRVMATNDFGWRIGQTNWT